MEIFSNLMFSLKNKQSQTSLMRKLHEYGILIFAFSLPIFEAPKHLGFCMMTMGFLGMTLYKKTIRLRKPDYIEWLLIAILITSTISTFLNWPLVDGIKGLKHVFYYISTFWMLYQNRYNRKFLIQVPIALVGGTLAGIFWAEYHLFLSQPPLPATGEFELKFNSINSVSRSGAFNATILFICAGVLMDNVYRFKHRTIIFFTISWVIISACILIMGGRGNVLGILGAYLFLLIPLLKHKKYLHFIAIQMAIALIAIIVLHLYFGAPQTGRFKHLLSTKFTTNVSAMALHDQMRYDYWRIGMAQISQHPSLFGAGPRNFKSIKVKDLYLQPPLLQESLELIGEAPQHSHNWVLTKWAEDGVVGLTFFSGLIFTLFFTLWKHRPTNEKGDVSWIWVTAFAAIIITVISGFFNSAFTHENGWLTFFLMGLGAGYTRQKPRGEKEQC
jgi:hypothetical protein